MAYKLPLGRLPTNIESIRLYRDILRGSNIFTWRDEKGNLWRDVLRKNARAEFEQARFEKDHIIVARLLVVGRDCLNQTMWKIEEQQNKVREDIEKTRNS